MKLFVPCLLLLASSSVFAQASALVVTGTRSSQSTNMVSAPVFTITREEIEAFGDQSIATVLNNRAGIQLSDTSGDLGDSAISLRGFAPGNGVLVMIDGRRLNNPDSEAPNLNALSLQNVERIEVITGSGSVLYGNDAGSGVINIITRAPKDLALNLQAGTGSYNRQLYRGFVGQQAGPLIYQFSVEKRDSDNYRDNNARDYLNLNGRLGFVFSTTGNTDDSQIFIEHQYVDDELETPGALFGEEIDRDPRQTLLPEDGFTVDRQTTRLGIDWQLVPQLRWLNDVTYREDETDIAQSFRGSAAPFRFTEERRVVTVNPRLQASYQHNERLYLHTLGYDFEKADYDNGFTRANEKINAVYWQSVMPLGDVVTLDFGYRHEEFDRDLSGNDQTVDVGEVGIVIQADENYSHFLRVAQLYRFPRADEDVGFDNLFAPVALNLEAEEGYSTEVGFRYQAEAGQVVTTLYWIDLDNEIAFQPDVLGPFAGANTNLDDTQRFGVTLSGYGQINDRWSIYADYAYVDAEFSDGVFDGNQVPQVSEHVANLGFTFSPMNTVSVFAEATYNSERYLSGDFANRIDTQGGYTLFNIGGSFQYQNFSAELAINNLLGKEYTTFGSASTFAPPSFFPAQRENVWFTLGYSFN